MASYICKFDENLDKLKRALEDLQAKRDDVLNKVDAEELKGGERLVQVGRWLSNVQIIENNLLFADASAVQQRRSTSCGCCCNIISTYRCGKKIPKMLDEVKALISFSSAEAFKAVTGPAPLPVSEYDPVPQTFGLDTKLQSTWSRLMDDGIRMLGLHGMGGVGKTILLAQINNKFDEVKDNFDVVIWIEVPKDADIEKIQNEIGKRLGLYDENWSKNSPREKRVDIGRVLKKKPRFVLLLDDLREEVKLSTIGIPLVERKYKVVFTTRSKPLCRRMGANEVIEVERLAEKDALDLLKQNAGRDTLDGEMLEHAKVIVEKCLGLPLALEVIGKCLSSKTTADEWRHVLSNLESSPTGLEGIENVIFPVLRYSYDNLKEDAKLCFQYCALFPKAYKIRKDELVEYWISQRIIDGENGRESAKDRGGKIIDTLVGAWFLLKDGDSEQKVYMHGLIRELALWIVIDGGGKFVVQTDAELRRLPDVENWRIVTKISLMNNEIESITNPPVPNPDRLVTLFLQNNRLVDIVGKFFRVLSTLVVLDLSRNPGITVLPKDISRLVSLRYLNLLGTRIKSLEGLEALIQLIHLDLESTSNLQSLSLISELENLQVLRFYRSAPLDVSLLKTLKLLTGLVLLSITVNNTTILEAFLGSERLPGFSEGLYLEGLDVSGVLGKSFAATFGELGSLSKLGMTECNIIESETEWRDNKRNQDSPSTSSNQITPSNKWFQNLSAVVIYLCVGLKDVTWLIYAENLKSLSITSSTKLQEVISQKKAEGVGIEPFENLQVLCLDYLDELTSIYWSPLSFPSLQKVDITECPNLQKLPLSEERIDALRIKLDDGWWLRGVEWERS